MLAWEGPCPPGKQVRHYDDDPDHNWWMPGGEAAIVAAGVGGLMYGTPKEQWQDKVRNRIPVTVSEIVPEPRRSRWVRFNLASRIRRWFV